MQKTKHLKAGLYSRVSTKEQLNNYSIENQNEKLESYCNIKEWKIFDHYSDGGFSGASMDRPDLKRLINDVKHKKIDIVIVYKLDRLSRSQKDTLELIDLFLEHDIEFVSVTENLDTSTPMGRAMIGIMSAFAQLERELIAERMRDGQIKRARAGFAAMGGDYDPAGFKRENGELITIEHEKEHIVKAFELYVQYHSITKVQRELKILGFPVWRFRRYRDILENPLYNGKVTYAGEVYEGRQEKFIADDLFNEVQRILNRHRGHNYHKAKESLLSGLIACSKCGENYVSYSTSSNKNNKIYKYYMCRARRFPSEYDEKCMNRNWNRNKLEQIIFNELQLITAEKEFVKKENIDYTQQINNVNTKIERMIELYANAEIDKKIIDKKIKEYNREKEELIKRQNEQRSEIINIDKLEQYVLDLRDADFATKRAIVEKLINRIYINDKNITIDWNF